ncbi:hypothetical protein JG688_00012824, partial [Phytophthora aleatoria]
PQPISRALNDCGLISLEQPADLHIRSHPSHTSETSPAIRANVLQLSQEDPSRKLGWQILV